MNHQNQRYFAELIGTFSLVFVGAGAVIANTLTGGAVGLLGIALAHGLILMAMIYALGNTSGAHFNPAVTLAMVFSQKMRAKTGLAYIVFQLIGSILAAMALYVVFQTTPMAGRVEAPSKGARVNDGNASATDSASTTSPPAARIFSLTSSQVVAFMAGMISTISG